MRWNHQKLINVTHTGFYAGGNVVSGAPNLLDAVDDNGEDSLLKNNGNWSNNKEVITLSIFCRP